MFILLASSAHKFKKLICFNFNVDSQCLFRLAVDDSFQGNLRYVLRNACCHFFHVTLLCNSVGQFLGDLVQGGGLAGTRYIGGCAKLIDMIAKEKKIEKNIVQKPLLILSRHKF